MKSILTSVFIYSLMILSVSAQKELDLKIDTNADGDTIKVTLTSSVDDRRPFFGHLAGRPTKLGDEQIQSYDQQARIYKQESFFYRNNRQLDSIITYLHRKPSTYEDADLSDTLDIISTYYYYGQNKKIIKKIVTATITNVCGLQMFEYDALKRLVKKKEISNILGFNYNHYLFHDIAFCSTCTPPKDTSITKYSYLKETNLVTEIIGNNNNNEPHYKIIYVYDKKLRLENEKQFYYHKGEWELDLEDEIVYKNEQKYKMTRTSKTMQQKYVTIYDEKGKITSNETINIRQE